MSDELRELLEAYCSRDVVTRDLIARIDAEFQQLRAELQATAELRAAAEAWYDAVETAGATGVWRAEDRICEIVGALREGNQP